MSHISGEQVHNDPAIITIRKLAALDMVFHGPKFILAEFAFGVFFTGALGFLLAYAGFVTGHFRVPWVPLLGCYLLLLALNYVPLLLYAVKIARRRSAQQEVTIELAHKERYARKYTLQSLLLLLPLVVPLLTLYQEWQKRVQQ